MSTTRNYTQELYQEAYNANNQTSFLMLELFVKNTPTDMLAKTYLGLCLLEGKGTAKDCKRAFELFKETAEGENQYGMTNLGHTYHYGLGVDCNITTATRFIHDSGFCFPASARRVACP